MHTDDQIIEQALSILAARIAIDGAIFPSPDAVKKYLVLKLAGLEHEVFSALWLNSQHKFIAYEELFRGTLNSASVYPREVAKSALRYNAGAAIFIHNHPSTICTTSQSDLKITETLKTALGLFDINVLDHIIVGGLETYSFAEHNLM